MILTYPEFLTRLRAKPREFILAESLGDTEGVHPKAICYKQLSQCSFLSIFYPFRDHGNDVIGEGDVSMAQAIYKANDFADGHDPAIRRDLEEACGL